MNIRLQDLSRDYFLHRARYQALFDAVCSSAAFCGGPYVAAFERDFAAYCGVRGACGVSSGSSALLLTLRALGVRRGDEVILPSLTFVSTAWAVTINGATPVFADVDPATWELTPREVARCLTNKTKAVVGVHLFGNLFDAAGIRAITDGMRIPLIEDAAHAHGAALHGKKAGALGTAGCFSFYPTKNLGAFGEGGCVVSDDAALIEQAAFLRQHAQTPEGDHLEPAFNERMHGIQAAILADKLTRLDDELCRRQEIADVYLDAVKENRRLIPQRIGDGVRPAYHIFALNADDPADFIAYMARRGIESKCPYPIPCHQQTAFADFGAPVLPATEYLARHCVAVPNHAYLTEDEVADIAKALKEYK